MKNPKGGRPVSYTKEQLLEILLEYTKKNHGKVVRLFELEAATGIKRHVWTYNMKEEIDSYNRELESVRNAESGIELPTVEKILTTCKGDEKLLEAQIQTLIDLVVEMSKYEDAAKAGKVMKRDYENKLEELECIIKEKSKKIEKLYEELDKLTMHSENPNLRIKERIESNVIAFMPDSREKFRDRTRNLLL